MLLVLIFLAASQAVAADPPATRTEPPRGNVTKDVLMRVDCSTLHKLQYVCDPIVYDEQKQQPLTCNLDNSVTVTCYVNRPNLICEDDNTEFSMTLPDACRYGAHTNHATALLLSIFCGLLGLDRFYLGYYTIGVIKLFSLGGLFMLYMVDVVLISLQALEPADGTGYIMNVFGPKAYPVRFDNQSYVYEEFSCTDCFP